MIWAANTIKQYAMYKKLKEQGQIAEKKKQTLKIDNFPKITTNTKLKIRLQMDQDSLAKKEKRQKSPEKVKPLMPTPSTNQFGTYLPTKKVDFYQSLQPEFVDETKQKA